MLLVDSLLSLQNWHPIPAYEYAGLDSEQASAGRQKDDDEEIYLTRCANLILHILAFHSSSYFLLPHIYFSSLSFIQNDITTTVSIKLLPSEQVMVISLTGACYS